MSSPTVGDCQKGWLGYDWTSWIHQNCRLHLITSHFIWISNALTSQTFVPKKIVFKVSASLAQMSRETTETSSHWFPPKPPKQMRNGLRDGQHPSPRHMMHALTMIQYLLWRQSIVKFLNRNPALGEHSRSQLARWAQKQPEDVIEYEPPWSSPHRQRSDMVKGIKTSTPSKLLCHCFRTCNSHKDLKLEKFKSCVYSSSRLSFVIETTI